MWANRKVHDNDYHATEASATSGQRVTEVPVS